MDWDLSCENCGVHYTLSPGNTLDGAVTNGMACPECGGKRFYRNQPNPTQSDMSPRDMVDSDSQKDQGGNPLGEGTIMGDDGEQSAFADTHGRDNFMHSHVGGFKHVDPMASPDGPDPPGVNYDVCPACGAEHAIFPSTKPHDPAWYCESCGQRFDAPRAPSIPQEVAPVHPDPGMDNEPGALTIPQHWGHKSVVTRELDMEPYEMDGLFDLPADYRSLPHRQAGSLWNSIKSVGQGIADVAPAIGEAGLAAAAPLDQEVPGLDVASDAAAAAEIGGLAGGGAADEAAQGGSSLMQKGLDMAKNQGVSTLKSQATNQIKQHLPGGGIAGLMKGALGVGAGGAAGAAAAGGAGIQSVPGAAGGTPTGVEEGAGIQTTQPGQWYGSVDLPMFLLADLETSDSIKSVGEQHGDDPEKVDQKEFNDRDKSPSNLQNPNNEDSGASGEDGVRENTEGYGFGPNSPSIDRAMMLMPLLLHYFQSEESGENDPLIKGLHDMLEQENPGYLQQQHPEGHKVVQEIIQLHKPHPGEEQQHQAGMAPGGIVPEKWPNPGGALQQNQAGSRCPNCGGVTNPDGSCPQCGTAAQQPGLPSTPSRVGNTVGPQTPEQKSVVIQYLVDHGRGAEAPNVDIHPEQYAKEMAEITRQPNVPPQPDPSQVTPLVPQPSQPGGMPMPDPGAANGPASGAPMQPMSSIEALVWPIEQLHMADANGRVKRCPYCNSGSTSVVTGTENDVTGDDNADTGVGRCHSCGRTFPLTAADSRRQNPLDKQGADSVAPRCPKCHSGTTGTRQGQEGITFECHACHHIWERKDVDSIKYKGGSFQLRGLVEVPNPNLNRDDSGMAWKDTTGQDLTEGQEYEISSAAFNAPTYATILKVHPNHLDMKVSGGVAAMLNPDENAPDFQIKRKEAQIDDYQFTPTNNPQSDMDDHNTEQPQGSTMPGLEQIPQQAPTTDEYANSFPNTSVSSVHEEEDPEEPDHCVKCGSSMFDSSMRDENTTLYQCVPCGHAWEVRDDFQGRESGVDLGWLLSGANPQDDFWSGYDRAQAMREAGTQSRNLGDIVSKDERYQAIHERLQSNAMQREAGKHFTPGEKRALINERGTARNLEDLNLEGTHYNIREDYSGKSNGMNVRDDDLFLGI